jgi:recombination protein RecR
MNYPSKILEKAVDAISSLPGIGKKTALRMALHLIYDKNDKAANLSSSLNELKKGVKFCSNCHSISDEDICAICSTSSRNRRLLCIVENVRDMMAIEDTGSFSGLYHILGGLISPLEGISPSDLTIDSLISRLENNEIEEIIMAISPTIDGDTTTFYISKKISHLNLKMTSIARGVSFGGELEYADEFTLGRSISARLPYKLGQ